MRSRIFSEDPAAGITRIWHYDDDTDMATIQTQMDVEPIIERNKAIKAMQGSFGLQKFNPKAFMHFTHSLPLPIWFDLKKRGILGGSLDSPLVLDDKEFARWLNDSDNSVWSVHEGKI